VQRKSLITVKEPENAKKTISELHENHEALQKDFPSHHG
jgi:hypothetical protein